MAEVVSFEQVVQRGCGLDVHKQTVVATIDGVGLKRETREFGTTTRSLTELKEWLEQSGITHVAMESTGVYWKPVYHVLEPSGMTVWIINARHVKYVPGHTCTERSGVRPISGIVNGFASCFWQDFSSRVSFLRVNSASYATLPVIVGN